MMDSNYNSEPEDTLRKRSRIGPRVAPNQFNEFHEDYKMQVQQCTDNALLKFGLPLATVRCLISLGRKVKEDEVLKNRNLHLPKKMASTFFTFVTTAFLGTIFYAPFCIARIKYPQENLKEKTLSEQTEDQAMGEVTTEKTLMDDFSYPTDFMTNISDSDSSFFSDFNASRLTLEDEKVEKEIPRVTYEELRTRNRQLQNQINFKPSNPPV